ncbi:DUF4129 domain-containing protein [Plantactinospora sp. CA-290183]|uniref:DUF4129 domain-containing protein n=1 Tax=Plantactinospora sp. CA-290183 TaxID=3240006 RepID=UPI003D92DC4D
MSVSRWWTETTAAVGDVLPLPLVGLLLLLATALVALGWYHFPAWVPRRLPRWPTRRRRGRATPPRRSAPAVPSPRPAPELPPVPALVALADRLAGEGRYAESVRERLRGMVRELVDRRVLEQRPGMTVAELASAAARTRPEVAPPLSAAGGIFSELWYGQRPARAEHDDRMREHAAELHRTLTARSRPTDDGRGPA